MKKTILTILLMSVIATSYADDTTMPKAQKNNDVVYDNLTHNFVHKHSHKKSTVTNTAATPTVTSAAAPSTPNYWAALVAVGMGVGPQYPGSNTMIGQSVFAGSIAYKNRYFLSSGQGLGVNFINTKPWILGTSVNYSYGNNLRSKEFSGLTNQPDMFVGSLFANYTWSLYNFGVTAYKTIGQLEGASYYQATMTRAVPLSQRLVINLAVVAQYDDARYMQSLYGVNASESSATGLSSYNTQSGWDNISYGITPMYSLNKHWILTGTIAGISYLGQVAKSPLIAHKQNYAVAVGFIYNIF